MLDVLHVKTLSAGTFTPPAGCITNAAIVAAAGIEATKVVHRHFKHVYQSPGSAIVAQTVDVHIARASGTLKAIEAAITGALADDASRTVTIDLQKSTGGAAFASVLTATFAFSSSDTIRTLKSGTLNTTAFVDGDILRVVVTVAGGSGNQAQGLVVAVNFEENPQ